MLHAPLTLTTDKLEISLLLKSSPSPTPTSTSQTTKAVAGPRGDSLTRSSSVPLIPAHSFPAVSSQRTSISSTVSTATSNAPSTAATQVSTQQQQHQQHVQSSQHRPFLPPITGSNAPLPPPPPSLTSPRNLPPHHITSPHQHSLLPSPHHVPTKRPPPSSQHPAASPAKRQSKWTPEEDAIVIELRGAGMKWEDISERLPGRSSISCRLHYQNYLERRSEWDEERKNRLARLYERLKPDMWGPLAAELSIPWRAAEAMHWQLGEADMARRAGVAPFTLAAASSAPAMPPTHAQSAGCLPSGPPSASYLPSMAGASGPPGSATSFGPYRPNTDMGMDPRDSRDARRGRAGSTSGLSVTLGGVSGPPMGQAILPSLAELERGLTAIDGAGRYFEPRR